LKQHSVRTFKSADHLPRAGQLAWKIAESPFSPVPGICHVWIHQLVAHVDSLADGLEHVVRFFGGPGGAL